MDAPRQHSDTPSALPPGTRLGEFELLSLLGVGGFGIVYLALDHSLEREVAVKEYMPASLAGRTQTMHVSLRSQSDAETFALGLRSFVNEARLLARFDHPSLLKVHRFWEANGTAYMAMPVMRGRTVKEVRQAMAGPPDEAWMRALLGPLLGAIERLHSEGVYHRDIAPDNIQIEPGGHPVLLDFGAARRVIGDKSQMLTAILKPAYAPIEQYAEAGSVRQGPWTDIYALGATLHYVLLGRPPPPATARAIHDDLSQLTADALPGFSDNFLRIVDWMLAPRPGDRPQDVAALREVLEGHALPPRRRVVQAPVESHWDRTVQLPRSAADAPAAAAAAPAAASAASAAAAAPSARAKATAAAQPPVAATSLPKPGAPAAAPRVNEKKPAPLDGVRAKRLPWAVGAGAAAVVLAAAVLWPRAAPAPALLSAAPSAAAPAVVATAVPAALTGLPVAASTITTVVVPGAAAAAGPAPAGALPSTNGQAWTQPARPIASRPGLDPRVPAARAAGTATTGAGASTTAQSPGTTPEAVAAAAQRADASASTPGAAAATRAAAAGPEAICAGRSALMNFVCIERECLRSEFGSHGDCLKWRKDARRE